MELRFAEFIPTDLCVATRAEKQQIIAASSALPWWSNMMALKRYSDYAAGRTVFGLKGLGGVRSAVV
ncbi:hypothetical protein WME94_06255 [Sorangium sp. So ce429]